MVFNNLINHLKLWCRAQAAQYWSACCGSGGVNSVGYQAAHELEFKLSTLMDRSFDRAEAFQKEMRSLLDVHYVPAVRNPQNKTAKYIVDKMNRQFLAALEELQSKEDLPPCVDIPYNRVIVGDEAADLQERFRSVWGYVNTCYWYPLMGDEPKEIPEKFYVMYDRLEPYMKQLGCLLGLPETHVYSYGESVFRPQHCLETAELQKYAGNETIYTDKDFTWAVYFSHENTVSFAGTIVPKARELLSGEKNPAIFNCMERA